MSDFLSVDLLAGLNQEKSLTEINRTIGRISESASLQKLNLQLNIDDGTVKAIKEITSQITEMGTAIDNVNTKLKNLGISRSSDNGLKGQIDQIKQAEKSTDQAGKTAVDSIRRQREGQALYNKAIEEGNILKKESFKLDDQRRRVSVTREYGDRDGIASKSFTWDIDRETGRENLVSGKVVENRDRLNKVRAKNERDHNSEMQSIARERAKITRELEKANSMFGADSKTIAGFRNQMSKEGDIAYYRSVTKSVQGYTASLKQLSDAEKIRSAQQKIEFDADRLGRAVEGRLGFDQERALQGFISRMGEIDVNTPNWQQKIRQINMEFSNFRDEVVFADTGLARFSKQMASAMLRVPIYAATISAMYAPMRMFQDALRQTIEIDTQMTVLERVSNGAINMNEALESSIDIANRLGNTITELNEGLISFARQGYRGEDLTAITEVATLMSNVSDLSVDDSASSLTAAMKGFNIEAENSIHIVNAMNEVNVNQPPCTVMYM